jgi:DNA-binding PadR family transcriptional regulator
MQQEIVLAMLAKGPSQGYQLRARLDSALGPLGEAMNDGQIYVTLGRLEKVGLVARQPASPSPNRSNRKVYALATAARAGKTERPGAVSWAQPELDDGSSDRAERKVYELTRAGHKRVNEWLREVSRPKPDLAELHLKLIAAAEAGLADPVAIVDAQRRELLQRLRDAQRAAMAEPDRSDAGLLLEGIVLRLQADLRWLEACEAAWRKRRKR